MKLISVVEVRLNDRHVLSVASLVELMNAGKASDFRDLSQQLVQVLRAQTLEFRCDSLPDYLNLDQLLDYIQCSTGRRHEHLNMFASCNRV